mgnify:CR=1 FL=1|jgi:hypothetical protein
MRAICVRCGHARTELDQICPGCGHRLDSDGRLVAWLLSSDHLSDEELDRVQGRIRAGEAIRPSAAMLDKARRALGRHLETDLGLTVRQRVGLLATSVLLTPLVGWMLFVWWWEVRPRAAVQALLLSLPATVGFTLLVLYAR